MAIKLKISDVEVAFIAIGLSTLPVTYGAPVDFDSIGTRDFNDDGDLVLSPPCVRVRYNSTAYDPKRDNQKLTYQAANLFDCFVLAENLRSKHDERLDTLNLVDCVADCFAGARLQLPDGTWTEPIEIVTILPVMNEGSIVDQFYAVTFRVSGFAQFSGDNARFGAK